MRSSDEVITRRSTYPGVFSESRKSRIASKQIDPLRNRCQVPFAVDCEFLSVRISSAVKFVSISVCSMVCSTDYLGDLSQTLLNDCLSFHLQDVETPWFHQVHY